MLEWNGWFDMKMMFCDPSSDFPNLELAIDSVASDRDVMFDFYLILRRFEDFGHFARENNISFRPSESSLVVGHEESSDIRCSRI